MTDEELDRMLSPLRSAHTTMDDICNLLLDVLPTLVLENRELRDRVKELEDRHD